jgi:hypothetical protein
VTVCPVCAAEDPILTVSRDLLPSMQNYVHRTREAARTATRGQLSLATCPACGFSWNATFDPSKLEYDAGYDNAVPSAVMAGYYEEIAQYLGRAYSLARGGLVVDVGCGDGRFLDVLCRVWPECHGLGVDPALPGDEVRADGRIRLVSGVFSKDLLDRPPSLFLSRHVLEHMPRPVEFVRDLRTAMDDLADVPLFVEVPDLGWILEHRAFWDFCYEHCNYFTDASLAQVLRRAGFRPTSTRVAFGSQYRWMEAVPAHDTTSRRPSDAGSVLQGRLREYVAGEQDRVGAIQGRLRQLKARGDRVALWGMATKGIMFSLMVDPDSTLIDHTVDVNANKQGCYVPISGRRIEAPDTLRQIGETPLAVVVMNPNYLGEIAAACRELGVSATYLDASGTELVAA